MPRRTLPLAIATLLAGLPAAATTPVDILGTPNPTIQAEKKVITSADQMPRRSYVLPKLPSQLLDAPRSELDALAAAIDKDLATDLATLDIRDRATRTGLLGARANMALHRGDFAAAQAFFRDIRSQQEKDADKLTSGIVTERVLDARIKGGTLEQQRATAKAALASSYGAMPWDVVGDNLKNTKSGLELLSKNLILGSLQTNLDPAAKNLDMNVPANMAIGVISVRNQLETILPFRDDVVAVIQELVNKNQVAKTDVWTPRQASLAPDAKASPVVVGIWDSGTDVKLFKPASSPGIAFNDRMEPMSALVRPMGDAQKRLPELKQYIKGIMDMRAAIDSPDARALKRRISTMKPEEVKQFSEDMGAIGMWVHGTHVAGIAVEGNPFAQVTAVAMHWSSDSVPTKVDEASAARTAAAYKAAVDHFKKTNTRVVNMSWRYAPSFYEGSLAYHNVGKTPEERKQIANKLFAIEKKALEDAIRSAPEILFVAGSGNEDNSADFSDYIPAGFELPNLITAGAVDLSGTETAFSTFGKTVVVHANGYEVVSYLPGGEKMKLSGTSMASPQIANLAAKLIALNPKLTPVEVKALILKGAEKNGRVNLVNPKKTLELAAARG